MQALRPLHHHPHRPRPNCPRQPSHASRARVLAQVQSHTQSQSLQAAAKPAARAVAQLAPFPVVFHVCYAGVNQAQAKQDAARVIAALNADFNASSSNFRAGAAVFTRTGVVSSSATSAKARGAVGGGSGVRVLSHMRLRNGHLVALHPACHKQTPTTTITRRRKRRQRADNPKPTKTRARPNARVGTTAFSAAATASSYTDLVSRAGASGFRFAQQNVLFEPVPTPSTAVARDADQLIKFCETRVKKQLAPRRLGRVINIWIVDFGPQADLLGYSSFPWDTDKSVDGVVLARNTYDSTRLRAPYTLYKTATHELGHFFGLLHTFEDAAPGEFPVALDTNKDGKVSGGESTGDCIADTPAQKTPTYGNPLTNPNSWNRATMWMNHMDYTDDAAMFMFTKDQCAKMQLLLPLYRRELM